MTEATTAVRSRLRWRCASCETVWRHAGGERLPLPVGFDAATETCFACALDTENQDQRAAAIRAAGKTPRRANGRVYLPGPGNAAKRPARRRGRRPSEATLDRRERIVAVALANPDLTYEQIAAEFGCSSSSVGNAMQAAGLSPAKRRKSDAHRAKLSAARRGKTIGAAHAAALKAGAKRAASRRYRCAACGKESNAGGIGEHQRRSGHRGREQVAPELSEN